MEVVVTAGAIRRAKLQSNCHYERTNTHFFYRPDVLTAAQPTASLEIIYVVMWCAAGFHSYCAIRDLISQTCVSMQVFPATR